VIGYEDTGAKNPVKVGLYTSYAVPTATHTFALADGYYNSTIYYDSWTIASDGNECMNQFFFKIIFY
jgi:hypothetical protein